MRIIYRAWKIFRWSKLGHLAEIKFYAQNQAEESLIHLRQYFRTMEEAAKVTFWRISDPYLEVFFSGEMMFSKSRCAFRRRKIQVSSCKDANRAVNFLVFDEPTNHLDIGNQKKEVLMNALQKYEGTVNSIAWQGIHRRNSWQGYKVKNKN